MLKLHFRSWPLPLSLLLSLTSLLTSNLPWLHPSQLVCVGGRAAPFQTLYRKFAPGSFVCAFIPSVARQRFSQPRETCSKNAKKSQYTVRRIPSISSFLAWFWKLLYYATDVRQQLVSYACDFLARPPNQSVLSQPGDFSSRVPWCTLYCCPSHSLWKAAEATVALPSHS